MGSFIEINDTLRITKDQGFPAELDIEQHLIKPYNFESVKDRIYEFRSKKSIRIYKVPPVRNFLVEDVDGKWVYWGLCYILEIHHDYIKQETSGKYNIIQLNSPDEMRQTFKLTHYNHPEQNYFNN